MNDVLVALVLLGILAPLLSAWITALERRGRREGFAANERAPRRSSDR